MVTINFPITSTTGTTYTFGDRTWTWNGRAWQAISTTVGYTGSAGSTGSIGYTGSRGIDGVTTTTTIAATIVGTTSTTAGIPGYSTRIYTGSLNDGYTLPNGDLYIWKGGDTPGAGPTVEYLVVAGGGGGGFGASSSSGGGGGGAGGYRSSVVGESSGRNSSAESALSVIAGTVYSVTVGAGGATGATGGARGIDGSTSSFSTIVSIGGGGGGGSAGGGDAARSGAVGGSGGGGAGINPYTTNYGGAGTTGQGYAGGDSLSPAAPNYPSAGGGGAGSVGGSQVNQTTGGNGGSGLSSSITGTPTIRGGGGGGATYGGGTPGTGGSGGGGAGGNPTGAVVGTPNTGGGGGGGTNGTPGAAGGSGIVVIRYPDSYSTATSTTGTPTAVTTSGYRIYSWTTVGSGSITFPAGPTVTGQGWVFVGNIKGIPGEAAAIGYTGSAGSAGSAGSTGPKITSVTVTDSSYNNLDDTAVALTGGYIKIAGSGFESGCQVLLGTTLATSVSYVSSTEVRAQLPAASTGTYIIYLVNSDGGTAIRVNAVTFSATPSWTTGAALAEASDTAISIQLAATDATSYSLAAGSSLPSGITLSSGGLLSGTITGLSQNTTYNFTIIATDAELQDSTRAFVFDITVGDTYFKYATMLLAGNGTNLAQNNTIIDSSTNNFSITRAGNIAQGTFTPYGSNWSNYFDGTGDYLNTPSNAAFALGTGDFTMECWIYVTAAFGTTGSGRGAIISNRTSASSNTSYTLQHYNGKIYFGTVTTDVWPAGSNTTLSINTWYHVAVTRSSGTVRLFLNGVSDATAVTGDTTNFSDTSATYIGCDGSYGGSLYQYTGYISNARIVKGTAVYTSNFTPPTTPLTAIANTSFLTCQSNRFIDNSTNAFTITTSGSLTVQRFSPFSPTTVYSTSTIGGSGYFDGSGDSLTSTSAGIPPALSFLNGASDTGTIECWAYVNSVPAQGSFVYSFPPIIAIGSTYFSMGVTAAKKFRFYWWIGSATSFDSTIDVNLGCWNHLVAVRSGSTVYLYVNGQPAGSNAMTGISWASTAEGTNLYIGYTNPGSLHYLNGYVSNLRVVNGTAVYTSSFTPPTSPVTAITNTALLLNFTNAGIIDSAMLNNLETVGNAKISTALSKFGSGSLVFDGAGDLLTRPNDPLFDLSSGDFTIEFWFNTTTLTPSGGSSAGYGHILGKHNWNGGSGAGWGIWQFNQTIIFFWPTSALNSIQTGNVITATATWYHITVVRSGTATNNTKIYINGVQQAQGTPSVTNSTSPLTIGGTNATYGWDSGYYTAGYIDDIRITKGYARYTTTFTPPTTAHPLK